MSAVENRPARETRQSWRGGDCSDCVTHVTQAGPGRPPSGREGWRAKTGGPHSSGEVGKSGLTQRPEAGANQAPASPEAQKGPVQGEQTGRQEAHAVLAAAPEQEQEVRSGIVSWDSRPLSPRRRDWGWDPEAPCGPSHGPKHLNCERWRAAARSVSPRSSHEMRMVCSGLC